MKRGDRATRRRTWPWGVAAVVASAGLGCRLGPAGPSSGGTPGAEPPPPEAAASASRPPEPTIVSAHLARVDDAELDGQDGLLLVFSVEVDAAALDPRAFVVSRSGEGAVRPRRAVLAPASEDDENRSVLLVGEFGDASPEHQPSHVAVIGPLFAEDGARLAGLGTTVVPFAALPRVVAATMLAPGPGRCEGSSGALRTYWSDELRGVEPEDCDKIRMEADDGTTVHPSRFDDHDVGYDEAGQDNVLDLCVSGTVPIRRVWVEAGAFRDVGGHDSAAVELRIDDARGEELPRAGP